MTSLSDGVGGPPWLGGVGGLGGLGTVGWAPPDLTLVSGVLCGALVFLLRSHEPSWLRKALYFGISLVGGYAVTPATQRLAWLPEWPAAFLSAAAIVTLVTVLLDWSEATVPQLLTEVAQRVVGGSGVIRGGAPAAGSGADRGSGNDSGNGKGSGGAEDNARPGGVNGVDSAPPTKDDGGTT
ncbi:putative holin [Paraburkholderia aspalathi]|uniref:putative holin n=1 Tax=Paraburkholderia aspalathi TaxID=1324617 RepID=UPI0038B7770C